MKRLKEGVFPVRCVFCLGTSRDLHIYIRRGETCCMRGSVGVCCYASGECKIWGFEMLQARVCICCFNANSKAHTRHSRWVRMYYVPQMISRADAVCLCLLLYARWPRAEKSNKHLSAAAAMRKTREGKKQQIAVCCTYKMYIHTRD